MLSYKEEILGYVPKLQSKKLSIQIDLYNEQFEVKVIDKFQKDGYSQILCSATKI